MPGGRFRAKMSGCSFGHTRRWRDKFTRAAGRKRVNAPGRHHRRLFHSARAKRFLLAFLQSNVLRDARAHQRKRWYQHPKPPAVPHSRKRERDRHKHECDAHKDILECMIQARFAAAMPSASTPADIEFFIFPRLRQLPGKRLWDQTDVCSARTTKACSFEILSRTFRTKHSYLRSTFYLALQRSHRTRSRARLTFVACVHGFFAATLHTELYRLPRKH
jgi:hypothetical protein